MVDATHLSTENITAQDPKFFHDLTAVFQEVLDALPPPSGTTEFSDRISEASKTLILCNTAEKLQSLIAAHFNVVVRKIRFVNGTALNASVRSLAHIPPQHAEIKVRKLGSLNGWFNLIGELLNHQAEHLDLSSGRYAIKAIQPPSYFCDIRFSAAFFVLGEYIPQSKVTAEMLAAIMLHELGHVYEYIAALNDSLRFMGLMDELVCFQPQDLTREDLIQLLTSCKALLNKKSLVSSRDKDALIDALDGIITRVRDDTSLSQPTLLSLSRYTTTLVSYYIGSVRVKSIMRYRYQETFGGREARTQTERYADAFAARYGASKALAQGLQAMRLYHRQDPATLRDLLPATDALQALRFEMAPWEVFIDAFKISPRAVNSRYDPELKRFAEIAQSLYAVFKNPHLDPSLRDYYLEQLQETQALIQAWQKRDDIALREKIYQGLSVFSKYGAAAYHIFTENLEKQYDQLQTLTRSLVDNPLFYHSQALQKLINEI